MPKYYSIVTVTIKDRALFNEYVSGHVRSIEKYGGRFVVKGASPEIIEGSIPGETIVVHEFPDAESFRSWYSSDDYKPWKALRHKCAECNVILVRGCDEPFATM